MKTTIENIKRNITITRLVALFVFMLVSSNVSAQESKKAVLVSNEISTSVSTETSVASSTEFISWFVGNTKTSSEKTQTTTLSKKALINSGVKTNNVLIKNNLCMSVLFLFGLEQLLIAKYLARAVKGDDLRSPACSAWVRIPQVLFLFLHNYQ